MVDSGKYSETTAQRVVDDLLEAYRACRETLFYCIRKGGAYVEPTLIRELHDVSDVAMTSANLLMRGSRHHRALMRMGCDVLQTCADTIENTDLDDDQLEVAYVACLRAQESCRSMMDPDRRADRDRQDEAVEQSFPASDPATTSPKT